MIRKQEWVSRARFAPFLKECAGNETLAWSLYEWNARVASALLETIHHAEVLLRNAVMGQLQDVHPLAYPWHSEMSAITESANRRSAKDKRATPDDIISQLTLGFWAQFFAKSPANDDLWRHHLRLAFPGSPGTRQSAERAISDMRALRNRCAHQDSLLEVDPTIETLKILSLAEWIDPDARAWLENVETVGKVAAQRPVAPVRDVLVLPVAAAEGLAMYRRVAAYVCPQDRSFAPVSYLGFYCDQSILPFLPKIEARVVPTRWDRTEMERLQSSNDPTDQRLSRVMGYGLNNGWEVGEQFQVFLLSEETSSATLRKPSGAAIEHHRRGRGSAFVHRHRYFARTALLAANSTDQLES